MFCFRYKGNSTHTDKRVGVASLHANIARCEGDFADRDCSISLETGHLTLGSVRIEDEGPYVCQKGNELPRLTVDMFCFQVQRRFTRHE